jgi:predicted nucleic acid-binding protein
MLLFTVVLDACVLFPASLRDTLLRAADSDLYNLCLTDEILEEMRRNLVKKGMPEDKSQRLVVTIRKEFAEALITHHRPLIASMPNNEKDRHVLAAAVASRAHLIVTQNLRDFPPHLLAPFEVAAQSPDEFLIYLFHFAPERIIQILLEQSADLGKPAMRVGDVLDTLKQHAPMFVSLIRRYYYG